jgi:phosphatidylcholine synthase
MTILAWGVHLYTASSAVFGLWAVHASFAHDFPLAMLLMLVTLAIDSTDGMLARAVDVHARIPWFDGRRLDDICDFFTYVLVPASFLIEAGLLPHPAWAAIPVLASCYGFSRDDAKTDDFFFMGWPSYWNVLAIYLYLFGAAPWVGGFWVVLLGIGVFVPMRYLYPSRTRTLRPLTLTILPLWLPHLAWLSQAATPNRPWLIASLLVGPGYYFGLSIVLDQRARRSPR